MSTEFFDGSLAILADLENSINFFEAGTASVISSLVGVVDNGMASASGKNNWNKSAYKDLGAAAPAALKLLEVKAPDTAASVKAKGQKLGYTYAFDALKIYVNDTLSDAVAFRMAVTITDATAKALALNIPAPALGDGISTTVDCTAKASALAQAGLGLVGRYYFSVQSQAKTKLSFSEAQALSQKGIRLIAIYEDVADDIQYFTSSQGQLQGYSAYNYAKNTMHQPAGSAIYFAVDFDATNTQISGGINDYFAGVEQGFANASGGNPAYDIGVYGSGLCCQWLRTHRAAVKYGFLAASSGWNGFTDYKNWSIKQSFMKQSVCGFKVDPKNPSNNDAEILTTAAPVGEFTLLTAPALA
jgi:hypothetical protein